MKDIRFDIFSQYRGSLMGIAILGVCLLHAFAWAGVGDAMIAKAMEPLARIAFTEGFLFLSGFGLYYSFSKNKDVLSFYKKRVHRVLLPYMLMTAPFFLYGLVAGNISIGELLLKSSTLYFWFFGNDGMWYISMSVALYLIFPFVYRFLFENKSVRETTMRSLLLVALCILICGGLYRWAPDYFAMVSIGITKAPMFFLGMLVGLYACQSKALTLKQIFGGGILLCITFALKRQSDFFTPCYEMAYRLLLMPLFCIGLKLLKWQGLESFLSWSGKYSLEIYVLQMLMIGTIDRILSSIGFQSEYYSICQTVFAFAIVFAVCVPVHKGVEKVVEKLG